MKFETNFGRTFICAESNPRFLWFCLTMGCEWSRKIVPSFQSIKFETKPKRDLITCIFPCFKKKGLLGFTPGSY